MAVQFVPRLFALLLFTLSAVSTASRECEPSEMQACPTGWAHVGSFVKYCSATGYEGPCRPLISEYELNRIGKQQFMLTCGVDWACKTTDDKEAFVFVESDQHEMADVNSQTGPAFPEGIAEAVNSVKQATDQIDKPDTNEAALLKSLEEYGKAGLADDLNEEKTQIDLEKAAYAVVHLRVLKAMYSGGCPRSFSGCPADWTATTSEGMCTPPESYEGVCGPFSAELGPSSKEEVAWKCQASWPCAAPCEKDYDGCPAEWTRVGSLCNAPRSYDGICSPAMDFGLHSVEQKAAWSAQCGAPWSCAGSGA